MLITGSIVCPSLIKAITPVDAFLLRTLRLEQQLEEQRSYYKRYEHTLEVRQKAIEQEHQGQHRNWQTDGQTGVLLDESLSTRPVPTKGSHIYIYTY